MTIQDLGPYLRRLVVVLLVSIAAVVVISEGSLRLQGGSVARAPETVELVIPAGTAAQVEAGEEPPGIPDEMVFVLGDVLLVRNLDVVTHTLGPLLIPPESTASLPLDYSDNFALTCSFKPTKYLGLDVREPTTLGTRLLALAFAVPPTAAMLYIYSLLSFPINKPEDDAAAEGEKAS
jgi:hypothetical protein